MACKTCKWAKWERTQTGRISLSKYGECTFSISIGAIPASVKIAVRVSKIWPKMHADCPVRECDEQK